MSNDYQKQLDKILDSIQAKLDKGEKKPTLLLHACCAPCSSYVLEYLSKYFDITIFFTNPNIFPEAEHDRRLQELKTFVLRFKPEIKVENYYYNSKDYEHAIKFSCTKEELHAKEGGKRCIECYKFRMTCAFNHAVFNKFNYFTTTLSISPYKNADYINEIGKDLEGCMNIFEDNKVLWLPSDFKKRDGYKRSIELSHQYNLYRQEYCGCKYSIVDTIED